MVQRERFAPQEVEVPQRIFDDIFRHAERFFKPFGSVEWGCHTKDSDVDFLANMDDWNEVRGKWFNEEKFELIKYDQQSFHSIKLKRKDDPEARILNLIFTLTEVDYDIASKAIDEMQYFLKSPMLKDKMFRVRLFEMLKDTIRARDYPPLADRSGNGITMQPAGGADEWLSSPLATSTLTTGSYTYGSSSSATALMGQQIIMEEDRAVMRSIEEAINSDPAAETPLRRTIIQDPEIPDYDTDFDEDIPF